ncbi:MAG TPA: hypothetical protein DEP45_05355 [Armatimonadetes bacterium]|nr:hypothetical protein [Armatimonadota bacterium]
MLMHEWIRYRSQQVKQALGEEPSEAVAAEEAEEPEDAEAGAIEAAEAAAPEEAEEPAPRPVLELAETPPEEEAVVEQALELAAESPADDREAVLNSLQEELERSGHGMKDRLRQLQARQRQLPMDVDELPEEEEDEERPRRASETRQQLVQRLLDPTLTLREAALLIDVCPTTVRRYTDRGLLNCFRTPGNQRRFHLSEVLEFMERRERGEV